MRESIPYLDQYFGVWAIAIERVRPLISRWEHIQRIGIDAHLRSPEAIAARQSGAELTELKQADRESFRRISGARELAEISLNGTLMKQASSFDESTSTLRARRQVRDAMHADDVGGILLRIDSPGGTFSGTDDLAADVAQAARQKPVFAFIEDLGASAAYYVAAQATKVFSNRTASVGSIGTFAVIHDLSQQAENEGVQVHVVRAGEFKGMGTPGTEVTEEQLVYLQSIVDGANTFFLNAVAKGRGMPLSNVEQLADGRIHIGAAAASLKLTDGVRTLDEVVSELSVAARSDRTRRGTKMTTETADTHLSDKPQPATLAELKTALAKADSAFLLDCLEQELTVEAAKTAYLENLTAQLEMRDEEFAELKAQQQSAAGPKPGVNALGETSEAEGRASFENPAAEFKAEVAQLVAGGMDRMRAVSAVKRDNPDLHQAMLDEANEK